MAPPHPRSRVSHDHSDTLAHVGSKAVHSAIDARGFAVAERAMVNSLPRVLPERTALIAQTVLWPVVSATVHRNHRTNGLQFALNAACG